MSNNSERYLFRSLCRFCSFVVTGYIEIPSFKMKRLISCPWSLMICIPVSARPWVRGRVGAAPVCRHCLTADSRSVLPTLPGLSAICAILRICKRLVTWAWVQTAEIFDRWGFDTAKPARLLHVAYMNVKIDLFYKQRSLDKGLIEFHAD